MKFKDLIDAALPNLGLAPSKTLLHQLEVSGKTIAIGEAAKLTARGLVKGIDTFAAIAVKTLGPTDTAILVDAYVQALETQIRQLADAAVAYAPLALNVEANKELHGADSAEANDARKRREVGITEMRAEVRDVLLTAVGGEAGD